MKRIILGLLAVVLAMAGLVAVPPAATSADCPYVGCVLTKTSTEGKRNIKRAKSPVTFKVGIRSAGNAYPTGVVRLTATRKGSSGIVFRRTGRITPAEEFVSRVRITTPRLRKGRYTLTFNYVPTKGTVFSASRQSRVLKIR